jgi:hypothetical protein
LDQPQDFWMTDQSRAGTAAARAGGIAEEPAAWLTALRWYLVAIAVGNLVWEFVQLPLYTIWKTGSTGDIVFAAVHCTGGDILIATASLVLALLFCGAGWPTARRAYRRVAALTIVLGLAYTIISEWLNVVVRKSWAYSELMPIVPVVEAGLSPLLQWIVLPLAAFWWAARRLSAVVR